MQCPLGHTGSSQAWFCPAVAMPDPELTPLQSRDSRCLSHHPGPSPALTLLRRSPPPWCSGVLFSDALLVFSLLLLGSLSLIMSYWRQKRTMTPGGQGRQSESLPACSLAELLLGPELQMVSHLYYCHSLPLASGSCAHLSPDHPLHCCWIGLATTCV